LYGHQGAEVETNANGRAGQEDRGRTGTGRLTGTGPAGIFARLGGVANCGAQDGQVGRSVTGTCSASCHLTESVCISPVTAHRWARLAGDSWSEYLATRQTRQSRLVSNPHTDVADAAPHINSR
jgi:hypothetical protein